MYLLIKTGDFPAFCHVSLLEGTPPKFNRELAPESHDGTGRLDSFLVGAQEVFRAFSC